MRISCLFEDPKGCVCEARNEDFAVESGGAKLYVSLLLAGGEAGERRPLVVFLHGFPGNEKNLDTAQALRRIGFHVACFSYRGAWGSEGYYAVAHLREDTNAVLRVLYADADKWGIDREKLWLLGHSLGGFTALHTLAAPAVALRGAVLIAPCDLGMMYMREREAFLELVTPEDRPGACLRVEREGFLREEAARCAQLWAFSGLPSLEKYELLCIGGSRDPVTPPPLHIAPLLERNPQMDYYELDDGHAFANTRIALSERIGQWLCARS